MIPTIHPRLQAIDGLAELVIQAAAEATKSVRCTFKETRSAKGKTLRTGRDTPLWNALREATLTTFRKRGDKADLARFLGLSRQRLHELLVANTAMPDAERTLLLIAWIEAKKRPTTPIAEDSPKPLR